MLWHQTTFRATESRDKWGQHHTKTQVEIPVVRNEPVAEGITHEQEIVAERPDTNNTGVILRGLQIFPAVLWVIRIFSIKAQRPFPAILPAGEDTWFIRVFKLSESGSKFFFVVFPHFRKKQHHKDIALPDGFVVLVLQTDLRKGIEKVLPNHQFEKYLFIDPFFVFAADENFEFFAVVYKFRRRCRLAYGLSFWLLLRNFLRLAFATCFVTRRPIRRHGTWCLSLPMMKFISRILPTRLRSVAPKSIFSDVLAFRKVVPITSFERKYAPFAVSS